MRLNFTGRRTIDKQDARVAFRDDPVGSKRGYYFELKLELDGYKLPNDARVFAEAYQQNTLMRFDLGTVGALTTLSPSERRLGAFGNEVDGVKLRVKIVRADGPEAGKLLAEADGIVPVEGGGVFPLILLAGADLGHTPWRLELIPSDPHLPTLYVHSALGGKEYAKDVVAKPLLMTAAAREVFASLVHEGDHEDEPEHWASLWSRFAKQVLQLRDPPDPTLDDADARAWIEEAVNAFAAKHNLADGLSRNLEIIAATQELQELEEMS